MVAAPQSGTLVCRGLKSKTTYTIDIYITDVVGASVKFDGGAGASATSPDFYTFPEPVIIEDLSVVTGLTDTTKIRLVGNGKPSANILRYALHLTTLNNRPRLTVGVRAGSRLSAIQI